MGNLSNLQRRRTPVKHVDLIQYAADNFGPGSGHKQDTSNIQVAWCTVKTVTTRVAAACAYVGKVIVATLSGIPAAIVAWSKQRHVSRTAIINQGKRQKLLQRYNYILQRKRAHRSAIRPVPSCCTGCGRWRRADFEAHVEECRRFRYRAIPYLQLKVQRRLVTSWRFRFQALWGSVRACVLSGVSFWDAHILREHGVDGYCICRHLGDKGGQRFLEDWYERVPRCAVGGGTHFSSGRGGNDLTIDGCVESHPGPGYTEELAQVHAPDAKGKIATKMVRMYTSDTMLLKALTVAVKARCPQIAGRNALNGTDIVRLGIMALIERTGHKTPAAFYEAWMTRKDESKTFGLDNVKNQLAREEGTRDLYNKLAGKPPGVPVPLGRTDGCGLRADRGMAELFHRCYVLEFPPSNDADLLAPFPADAMNKLHALGAAPIVAVDDVCTPPRYALFHRWLTHGVVWLKGTVWSVFQLHARCGSR